MSKKKRRHQTRKTTERGAVFQPEFREDLRYWVHVNRKVALRAFDLIEAIMRDPFIRESLVNQILVVQKRRQK